MQRKYLLSIMLVVGCLYLAVLNAEQNTQSATPVEEIAPGVFVKAGHSGTIFQDHDIANTGFITGSKCVAVVDTGGSIEEGEALLQAIRLRTSLPICYVINTHVHPDHILGNAAFKDSKPKYIGHSNLPRAMQLLGPTYLQRASTASEDSLPAVYIVPPDETVLDKQRLDLGGRYLTLQAQPQAHTDNDLTVFDEKTETWWLGDLLFSKHIPVIGGSGSLKGWLKLLGDLQKQEAVRVVPGHGPVTMHWPDAANAEISYLNNLLEQTRAWLEQDGELPEAMNAVGYTQKDKWEQFDEFHKRNISTAYTELEWED